MPYRIGKSDVCMLCGLLSSPVGAALHGGSRPHERETTADQDRQRFRPTIGPGARRKHARTPRSRSLKARFALARGSRSMITPAGRGSIGKLALCICRETMASSYQNVSQGGVFLVPRLSIFGKLATKAAMTTISTPSTATMSWGMLKPSKTATRACRQQFPSDHPEIQEKIRRCIKQGHIDPEDFNGVRILVHCLRTAHRRLTELRIPRRTSWEQRAST